MANRPEKSADNERVMPWQGKAYLRPRIVVVSFFVAAVAWLALVGWLTAATAEAAEASWPTAQATAVNAEWVPYLDPPEKPAAVCLVDSGVAVTPDTPPDSPAGPIVKRLAVDGGSGEESGSNWEGLHGTRMAFVGAAPMNGWGAVGFWPGARVVSIRAMAVGETSFPFENYGRAVDLCSKELRATNAVVVNLSLGCDCGPTSRERERLANYVAQAHANGQSVVAAAGNNGGGVGSPASTPGVLAVAASDNHASLCAFSNRGPSIYLIAAGCEMDLADPSSDQLWRGYQGGTSAAAMAASTTLALLRSYRPDLARLEAEQLVARTARSSASGPLLDLEALFLNAGLSSVVDAAKARVPASSQRASDAVAPAPPPVILSHDGAGVWLDAGTRPPRRLASPRIDGIVWMRRRLTVSVSNRPPRAQLSVIVQLRRGEFDYAEITRARGATDTLSVRLARRRRVARVVVRYELPSDRRARSVSVYRRVHR